MLILDEVFVGFRLAYGGAQEYFGVRADMVTYGKTLPAACRSACVCGRARSDAALPRRPPVDICFARGTFNAHPYVMGAMYEFLRRHRGARDAQRSTNGLTRRWNERARAR